MKLKHTASLFLISAFAATSMAQAAQTSVTVNVDDYVNIWRFEGGVGTLSFSEDLVGALQTAAIQMTPIAPSVINTDGANVSVNAAVSAARFDLDTDAYPYLLTAQSVTTVGGVSMVAATKNFATTGGSLTITGIKVDVANKAIYANLVGDNGVGTQRNVHVWNFDTLIGDTTKQLTPYVTFENTLSGLTITDNAFGLFAQSLGLRTGGINAMRAIADYGTMNSSMALSAMPEPSTYVLMGLGVAGIALAARRRRA